MKTLFLLLTACALSPVLAAADSARQPPEKQKPAPSPPPAKTATPAPAAVQKMASDFSQQREAQLHDRKALLEKLRTAKTDDEKQSILSELRRQQQQRLDEQREAARQKRDELRETRK
jgi:hypothetical protein